MKLKQFNIKDFKGIKNFSASFENDITSILGANATGKTTLADAFFWLLFGKDSLNSAQFDIKGLNDDGHAESGLDHTVEAVLDMDGTEKTLKKVYSEKWVKRRGSATREFTGHTTDHFIDGVPVKKKEYDQEINSICDEDLFRLLTNPRYFNEVIHWQDRRKMLLEVCGDITDEDVIASNSELAGLPDILKKRKIEDHRKVIASRRAEINKELEKIPVRIDEIKSSAVETRSKVNIEKNLAEAEENKTEAEKVLKEIKAGGESEVLTTELRKVENKIQEIENTEASAKIKATTKRADERRTLKKAVDDFTDAINIIDRDNKQRKSKTVQLNEDIKFSEREVERFRKIWHEENDKEFDFNRSGECPKCGYDLLEDERRSGLESFNKEKAEKLEAINQRGKQLVKGIEETKKEIEIVQEQIESTKETKKIIQNNRTEADAALKEHDDWVETDMPPTPEKLKLLNEKESIEKQIADKLAGVDTGAIKTGEEHIETIEAQINGFKKELLQIEANARIDVRVKELSDQERNLSAEYEDLEHQLYLTEQFVRTKVFMLENKINSKFKVARFKLFEEQINEGLRETCVAVSSGVPYGSMNNAARIQIGIDICNTLSEHFGKVMPLWIDNQESVSEIPDTAAQQIRLIVSPKDEKLRIEQ